MPDTTQFQTRLCSDQTVFILDGQTVSTPASINGTSLVAVDIPTGFDGTSLTFQVSTNGVDYVEYKRMLDGANLTAVVGANSSYATGSHDFAGYNYIKLVAVSQTGDIEITLKTRPL
jgi:hypothetical protein